MLLKYELKLILGFICVFKANTYNFLQAAGPTDYIKKYQRVKCEDLLKRKFFYVPSFEIYGGVAGLYDYGPLGSQLKSNVETQWRQHFVLEDDMLEVTCSNLTLDEVLKTSVSYFKDFSRFSKTLSFT